MKRIVVAALLGCVLVSIGVAAGAATAKRTFPVDLNEGYVTSLSVPPDAQVQVLRLAVEDAPLKLLVVTKVPGEGFARFQFLTMDAPATHPDDPICPPSFVPTVQPGGCVPPNHPLARPR